MERRLVAILATDVVGYSRLMKLDDGYGQFNEVHLNPEGVIR